MEPAWQGVGRLDEGRGEREVRVELAGGHLGVFEEGQAPRWWVANRVLRIGRGGYDLGGGVVLRVADSRLEDLLDGLGPARSERLWPKALVLLFGLGLMVWGGWRYGLPALAGWGAGLIPVKYERQIGAAIADAFASPTTLARDGEAQRALNRMVAQLARGFEGEQPYAFTARLHCLTEINAAAAPGGTIVVLNGLVKRLEEPGQLAAILAHEMEHGALRHGTKAICRRFTLQLGFGFLMGDLTSVAALVAAGLTDLGYTREDELEADREGARLMARAGLDPQGMVSMFGLFAVEEGKEEQVPSYLRTHPYAAERRAQIERLIGGLRRGAAAELERSDWELVKQGCRDQQEVRLAFP